MNSSREIFKYFVGSWDINRIVGSIGIASGVAKFVLKDSNNILYREDLNVLYNNSTKPESAYKEYIYTYNQDLKKSSKNLLTIDYSMNSLMTLIVEKLMGNIYVNVIIIRQHMNF